LGGDAVEDSLGELITGMRATRRLSLRRLADRAGVGKSTLSDWEKGTHLPRLPELEAVLAALEATPDERRRALAAIPAPRAARRFREAQESKAEEAPPPFTGGDLLRAMRRRERLSLEQVADHLNVRASTVSRWESSRTLPSPELLDPLFELLRAYPQERAILSDPGFLRALPDSGEPATLEQLEGRLMGLVDLHYAARAPMDLGYLSLQSQIRWVVADQPGAYPLLAEAYRYHAAWLLYHQRWREAAHAAECAMELYRRHSRPSYHWAWPVHLYAQAVTGPGNGPQIRRGIEVLESFPLSWAGDGPAYGAMLLRDLGKFYSGERRADEAQALFDRADELLAPVENRIEPYLCRADRARALLTQGDANGAAAVMPPPPTPGDWGVRFTIGNCLTWAEIMLGLNDKHEAHEWMDQAFRHIDDYQLPGASHELDAEFRSQLEALTTQF
jgi:transcriptional regulator with XRE-family HTH domain